MKKLTVVLALAVIAATSYGKSVDNPRMPDKTGYRVNCGASEEYTDADDVTWQADQILEEGKKWGAVGGRTATRSLSLEGDTPSPDLYLAERYGLSRYEFTLPDGSYTVKLHFAETFDGVVNPTERDFGVKIGEKMVLENFDIMKEAGAWATPIVKEFTKIEVTGGKLKIEFVHGTQNPLINAIEIY
jgi:hypothetical protein